MVTQSPRVPADRPHGPLAELWGDTVDLNHLGLAVVIGAVVSLCCFLLADRILGSFVDTPQVARTYAMLAGLVGCLVGGAICAVLFKPKRLLTARPDDPAWREEAMADLVAGTGSWGSAAAPSGPVSRELRELGLDQLFAAARPDEAAPPLPTSTRPEDARPKDGWPKELRPREPRSREPRR